MLPDRISLVSQISVASSSALLPLFAFRMGASPFEIGLILLSYNAANLLGAWIFGRYVDGWGAGTVLQIGLVCCTGAFFFQALAYDAASMMVVRFAAGFAAGMYPPALFTYSYETEGRLGPAVSLGAVGVGLGTVVAGLLDSAFLIFLMGGALFGLTAIVSFRLPKIAHTPHLMPWVPLSVIKENAGLYLSVFIRHSGATAVWVIYPLFLASLGASPWLIGLILGINFLFQFLASWGLDRYRSSTLVHWGYILSAVVFVGLATATSLWWLPPFQALLGIAWSFLYVGAMRAVMEGNPEHGTANGLLQSSFRLAGIIGPPLGGILATLGGYQLSMWVAFGCCIAAEVTYLLTGRWQKLQGHPQPRELEGAPSSAMHG